ncbi:selenocysteine-specific translation elongation factor [Desulfovibrio aminophilus]|uniref:selenocysteine-specific translation elongation factor n=1 Tax=Desulfovibrio aminophilus TaxID=81425 RepID=UPI0004190B07|nr:selenocysteine-specific translation elongation factor [Desulfovibrio aminophilus]
MPVIMGTAGHIDHGKTSLVRALTGIDCDRLAEEKRRGITIELGFAFLDLPDGSRLGIVDVPGHERFVKNMVAGAAGIDFVLLVIAADEGIMPQTREHLEICSLLGVQAGLVALTKADMVDEEWLEMVRDETARYLEPTFLGGAPMVPVSAVTGQGLDELRAAIAALAADFAPRRRSDLFRLPVDRVFSIKGHGTVVTGTSLAGKIAVGEEVQVYPKGRKAKVRGLECHGAMVNEAPAGVRTAVNLGGLEVSELERGDVLARPDSLFPSQVWDVELTCLASTPRSLKHRKEVHFHHGAREVMARVYFLDREELKPGDTALCQVRFEEPLAGVYGDRVVLRSFSPLRTIAGGRIVNPLGRRVRRFSSQAKGIEALRLGQGEDVLRAQLELVGPSGLTQAQLLILTDMESKALEKALGLLGGRQEALQFDRETRTYVAGSVVAGLIDCLTRFLGEFHRREPMRPGLARGELASTWGRELPSKLFHFLVERAARQGTVTLENDLFRLPGHRVSLASDTAKLREAVLTAYEAGGLTPPNLKDVLGPLGVEFKEAAPVFKMLQDEGKLTKIKEEMYFATPAVTGLTDRVRAWFAAGREEMEPSDFRDLSGLSRKYSIPLLEWLDKEKVTVRVGDNRRLRKRDAVG